MTEIISFGEWMEQRRKRLGLTRKALAALVGSSAVMIQKVERDERRPSVQLAQLLAHHLQIPEDEQDDFVRRARGEFVPDMPPPMTMNAAEETRTRYVLGALLAEGGHGQVYRGEDLATGQPVVIKRLKPHLQAQPELITRFLRESEALRQLNHPNIVQMLDAFEADGRHTIVMEYVSGGSLRQLLDQKGQLSEARSIEIALELADALSRAHHLDILHRDLKPDNVLLAANGSPRLTDFGVARLAQEPAQLTATGVFVGSPAYLSPEALRGETVDGRSDIWSFGVLLYEMLAGRRPFVGEQMATVLAQILHDSPPPIQQFCPDISPALTALISQMLQKTAVDRPHSMRQIAAALEAIGQGRGNVGTAVPWQQFVPTPITPAITIPHNLPTQATPFLGREAELTALGDLLAQSSLRLVTIVGSGGMGKTRLSITLAERLLATGQFTNGVFFVPLAPLNDPEQMVLALAEALHFPLDSGGEQRRTAKEQVLDYLREKRLLLVLDNFEHLLAPPLVPPIGREVEGAALVADILRTAVNVQILVTSRERLQLQGEQVYPIEGLAFPENAVDDVGTYTAVQLFLQAAQRILPDFVLQADDLPHLTRICQLVGGMPLGVELAAGWVDMLPLAEIASEMQRSSDFLETELRDVPERHRSMRVVFEASWQRLTADEQAIFPQLSVFRGGFTRQAGQAVTGASLRLLGRLVSKSLLQYDRQRDRYEIHELLRQFGAEVLAVRGEETAVKHQHSRYYCAFLHEHEPDMKGARQQDALLEIELEMGNVQQAWRWATAQKQVSWLAEGMDSLGYFLEWNGRFQEGLTLFQTAADALLNELAGDVAATIARLLGWQSAFSYIVQNSETAVSLCEQALSLLPSEVDTRREEAFILYQMGQISSDHEQKKDALKRSLQLHRELDNEWGMANVLQLLGDPDLWYGTSQELEQWLEECLAIQSKLGDQQGVIRALILLSNWSRYHGLYLRSEQLAQQALQLSQTASTQSTEAYALYNLGFSVAHLAKFEEAQDLFRKSAALYAELGDRFWLGMLYFSLGLNALSLKNIKEARRYSALFDEVFPDDLLHMKENNLGHILLLEARFEEALPVLYHDLELVYLSQNKVRISVNNTYLAIAEYGCGRIEQAKQFAYYSLQNAVTEKIHIAMQHAFISLNVLLADLGEVERAIELDTLSRRDHPLFDKSWNLIELKRPFLEKVATLPPEIVAAAQEQGRQLDYWQTAESLLTELTEQGWDNEV